MTARLNGRDEHGFTPDMRARMRRAVLLHEWDEREEEPVTRRHERLRALRVVRRRKYEQGDRNK